MGNSVGWVLGARREGRPQGGGQGGLPEEVASDLSSEEQAAGCCVGSQQGSWRPLHPPSPLHQNLNQNPRTLLPKFYGLYCVQSGGKNIRVVVMNNVLPRVVKMHAKLCVELVIPGRSRVS